jgi:hypothetical protein
VNLRAVHIFFLFTIFNKEKYYCRDNPDGKKSTDGKQVKIQSVNLPREGRSLFGK